MWLDTRAALAEIEGSAPAEPAPSVADVAKVAAPLPEMTKEQLACDAFEERAAIREFSAGQSRPEAERAAWQEARRAAGITALDEWRARADDVTDPENWR